MIQQNPHVDHFKQQLRGALQQEAAQCHIVKQAKHANIYTSGEQDTSVFFIGSGQVKLLVLMPDGKECLHAVLTPGDILGELCLSGLPERQEMATAMEAAVLKALPCAQFFSVFKPAWPVRRVCAISGCAHRRPTSDH